MSRRKSFGSSAGVHRTRAAGGAALAVREFKRAGQAITEGFCRKGLKHITEGVFHLGEAHSDAQASQLIDATARAGEIGRAVQDRFIHECGVPQKKR